VRRSLFITQKRLGPTLFLYPDRQAKVLAAGKKYNVPVGYPSGDPDEINRLVAEGFRFFQASTDLNMMKSAATEMLGKVQGRKTAPSKPAAGIYGEGSGSNVCGWPLSFCDRWGVHLPFDISQLLGHLAIPNTKDVYTAKVPGLTIAHLSINPKNNATVPGGKHLLGLKEGVRRTKKEFLPECPDGVLALITSAVRRGVSVFEDAIGCHRIRDGIDIMAIEGLVKPANSFDRSQRLVLHAVCVH
jgi:hypothetical protein